jgi:hypothetical protein
VETVNLMLSPASARTTTGVRITDPRQPRRPRAADGSAARTLSAIGSPVWPVPTNPTCTTTGYAVAVAGLAGRAGQALWYQTEPSFTWLPFLRMRCLHFGQVPIAQLLFVGPIQ